MSGPRVGIASQTPLVRMKRDLDDLEVRRGPLPDPLPLDRLRRSTDYSVTPGGVGRMIGTLAREHGVAGEWITLSNGFPRDLVLGRLRLGSVALDGGAKESYGNAKEVVWEALNGLPSPVTSPLEDADLVAAFGAWSARNATSLLARHAADPFDVFYVNDWQHLPQGRLLGGAPSVLHFHAPFAPWTPPGWKDFMLRHFAAFGAVVVSTRAYAAALADARFPRPVHQVYPWIDARELPRVRPRDLAAFEERYGVDADDEVVLHVGRMDPVKGQDRLVRAFARVAARRPRAKLVLVGNGSFSSSKEGGIGLSKGARWRAGLERIAAELGVAERVVFTGHVDHLTATTAFRRADAFAFPSVAEGFGLAVAEAWLQRAPAVVDPGAGIAEVVRHGENGLVARFDDPAASAAALERVLADPEGAARMGEEGRRTALEACDVRRRGAEVAEILDAYAERRAPDLPTAVGGTA